MSDISMVSAFVDETTRLLEEDNRVMIVLSGIRQYSFRNAMRYSPERVIDLGIMEQNAVGFAAGLSSEGFIPFLHTWTPFLIERAFDQIRLFGTQGSYGNFIGAGGSYDLSDFGDSHYCPECIPILKQIKCMQIIAPGTSGELRSLLRQTYSNHSPTYYSLSTVVNSTDFDVRFGEAIILKQGAKGVIIIVGPMLYYIEKFIPFVDATILYYTTIEPFDKATLKNNMVGDHILICEPYNESAVLLDVIKAIGNSVAIDFLCIDKNAKCRLGSLEENRIEFGFDDFHLREKLQFFFFD